MSLGEQLMKPSAMMYRNFLALEVEEVLRAYPVDSAVLLGGCDKTTPGVLMGAISMNLPCVYAPAGAMMRGIFAARRSAAARMCGKHWTSGAPGGCRNANGARSKTGIARTPGVCMTMGTGGDDDDCRRGVGLLPAGGFIFAGGRFRASEDGARGGAARGRIGAGGASPGGYFVGGIVR